MLLLVVLVITVLILAMLLALSWFRDGRQKFVTYRVTSPSIGEGPSGEIDIYPLIYELLREYRRGHILKPTPAVSLEVISSAESIVFYVGCPIDIGPTIKSYLISFWPKLQIAKVREGSGFSVPPDSFVRIHQWRTGRKGDGSPMEHILSGMHGLAKNETVAFQFIISPYQIDPVPMIGRALLSFPAFALKFLVRSIGYALFETDRQRRSAMNRKVVKRKDEAAIFSATIRSLVIAQSERRARTLDLSLAAAIRSSGLSKKQSGIYRLEQLLERRHYRPVALPVQDLARLFYFPTPNSDALGLERAQTAILETPVSFVNSKKPEVILGINDFNDRLNAIGLSGPSRQKHLLVIGATGMGKSTLLGYSLVQDILAGRGIGLIDPHGDLAQEMLRYIPSKRVDDVIYVDPSDIAYPVGLNLLELPEGLSQEESEMAKDLVTEAIVSIFRKVFSEDGSGGHRIEYILRNVIHTAFYVEGATLFTLNKLLTNDTFRSSVVASIDDASLRDFWYGEFNKAGSYQRVKMIAGVTAKLGRFQRSVVTRKILEQEKTTIDFDEVLDRRKLLICNLSKGAIGEDTSSLLGMVILAKLQLAAWRRSLKPVGSRKPYYLYVDEFQSFASHTLTQMVSESRKYGICLTLAEQTTANQSNGDSGILLSNIGNVVCFRLTAPTDIDRLMHLFAPELSVRDFADLPSYHFYMKQIDISEPIAAETMLMKGNGSAVQARRAIQASRKHYGRRPEAMISVKKSPEMPSDRVPLKRM